MTLEPINVAEFEEAARTRLDRMAFDYYAGGSWDEITLRDNERAYRDLQLQYRVLRDVSKRELGTTVLGQEVRLPVLVAPTAFHELAHPEGEVATAEAARRVGTILIVSTLSNRPIEEVVAAAHGPVWFQLYVYRDRQATAELVARAEAAGCQAIVLTVDAQLWGQRERDTRNRFQLPEGMSMSNLWADGATLPSEVSGSGLGAYVQSMFDPSLSWPDVDWLCNATKLPVVVKGIVHPEDARLARDHGAQAVVVSNHGGRQVDTAPPTIEILPEVVEAVGESLEVLVDGGIRRGSDVVKAVAVGARAVLVGRPVLWGLAVGGADGVVRVFELLRNEFDLVMGLCGASRPSELAAELVRRRPARL